MVHPEDSPNVRGMLHICQRGKQGQGLDHVCRPHVAALWLRRDATAVLEHATSRIIASVFLRDGAPIKSHKNACSRAVHRAARGGSADPTEAIVRPQFVGRLVDGFRRTTVRHLEQAGIARSVAMRITGHKTESVYKRYAITTSADVRDALTKLGAHMQRSPLGMRRGPEGDPGGFGSSARRSAPRAKSLRCKMPGPRLELGPPCGEGILSSNPRLAYSTPFGTPRETTRT